VCHSNLFQPSNDHPQGMQLIYSSIRVNKMSHQMWNST